jgi:Zn finger protein HypA/HybF involved in hydrogenase expression
MATKVPAAQNRLFKNVFICKICNHRMRVEPLKVMAGKVRCRKCQGQDFRVVRKK